MKSLYVTKAIQETLNLSEDPPDSLLEGSPEYPKLKELLDQYYITLNVHHRHDESRIHQMEMIVQGILKRESGREYWESSETATQIVKDFVEKGGGLLRSHVHESSFGPVMWKQWDVKRLVDYFKDSSVPKDEILSYLKAMVQSFKSTPSLSNKARDVLDAFA